MNGDNEKYSEMFNRAMSLEEDVLAYRKAKGENCSSEESRLLQGAEFKLKELQQFLGRAKIENHMSNMK